MILAHLADVHLGYRAYQRTDAAGLNIREADVAGAWHRALERVIGLQADLLLIAGDLFHTSAPPGSAVVEAFRGLTGLRAALPHTPVVIIAGNQDAPRSEVESPFRILSEIPGVLVADHDARHVVLEALDTVVACFPHHAVAQGIPLDAPTTTCGTRILLLHGEAEEGPFPRPRPAEPGGARFDAAPWTSEGWHYIALGHRHTVQRLAPNAWYAGATERTTSSIWDEPEDKGFLTFDTDTGEARFHPLDTRPVIDLPALDARAADGGHHSATELDALIREHVDAIPGGIDGKIVRLVIQHVSRPLFRQLDHARLRSYRLRALHLHLDPRHSVSSRDHHVGRLRTLEAETESFLHAEWQPSGEEIDRSRLISLAHLYFAQEAAARAAVGGPDRDSSG